MTKHVGEKKPGKLRVQLIGIAGTSCDILLSIFTLKSFVLSDKSISKSLILKTTHKKYILPSKLKGSCQNIATDIVRFRSDIVGFSTYTWNYDAVMMIAQLVKKANPHVKVLLGGPEIASNDIIAGKFDDLPIDYIIVGEGEMPFLRFDTLVGRSHKDHFHLQ